jgi:hypothetical protein
MMRRLKWALTALLAIGSLSMPAHAAEGIECVEQTMTAQQRAQLADIARLDRHENSSRFGEVFTILGDVARSCASARGWSGDAADDAMKYSFYRIVVAVAEGEGGIPAALRQRADGFLASEPADIMEQLSSGTLNGELRAQWINRLAAAVYPGRSVGDLSEGDFATFHWLNMYLLFRQLGQRRVEIFRNR